MFEELAILIEDLDAVVRAIADVQTILLVDHDRVHRVHVVRPRLVGRIAAHAPRCEVLAVPVEFDDARIDVAVADEEGPIRQPNDVGRTGEVRFVIARGIARANRLHERFAVARELEDGMRTIVHEPDMPFGIVGVHENTMRTDEQIVVLLPRFNQPAVAIDDVDDVVLPRMTSWIFLRPVVARCIARRNQVPWFFEHREAPSGKNDHAIRGFSPDTRGRSDLEPLTAPVLRPTRDQVIRTRDIAAALLLRRLREPADGNENDECR